MDRKGSNLKENFYAVPIKKGALEIISINEMDPVDREEINLLLSKAGNGASLLGVAMTTRPWDYRPIVLFKGEEEPSIVRFFGPEVSLVPEMQNRCQRLLERFSSVTGVNSRISDWGVLNGRLWYRRPMAEHTFADVLESEKKLKSVYRRLGIAGIFRSLLLLIKETNKLHFKGLVHGHIIPGNVWMQDNKASLLDLGIGLSALHGTLSIDQTKRPKGYQIESFAPELLETFSQQSLADIFGLGLVFSEAVEKLTAMLSDSEISYSAKQLDQEFLAVDALRNLSRKMCKLEATERIELSKVEFILAQEIDKLSKEETGVLKPEVSTPVVPKVISKPEIVKTTIPEETIEPSAESAEVDAQQYDIAEPEDALEIDVEDESAETTSSNSMQTAVRLGVFSLVLVLGFVLLRTMFSGSGGTEYSNDELEFAWYSKTPSKMSQVAEVALNQNNSSKEFAELLIIKSAMNGEVDSSYVNLDLLKISFDKKWEGDLKSGDRRAALALALAQGVITKLPEDLKPLKDLHPAVILGLVSSTGKKATNILKTIPASRLADLPAPYGAAFKVLSDNQKGLTCGDPEVIALAELATGEPANGLESVVSLVKADSYLGLRSIGILYSQNNLAAKQVLEILLNHPNVNLKLPVITWAQSWKLTEWDNILDTDKLFLIAGIPVTGELSEENIAMLITYPSPEMRGYAIEKAINKIPFEHPGALDALQMVKADPKLLSSTQLVQLANLLKTPSSVSRERVVKWLDSKPPQELIVKILLASTGSETSTNVDFEFARYLHKSKWNPGIETLRTLIRHPDKFARFYSYSQIFELKDKKVKQELLSEALKLEKNEMFQEQLKTMLNFLNAS